MLPTTALPTTAARVPSLASMAWCGPAVTGPATTSDSDDGGRVCIEQAGRTWMRADVRREVAALVAGLRTAGVRPGHSVLALLEHDARGVFLLAAADALGLRLLLPYNLQAAALPEWRTLVAAARPDAVVDVRPDPAAGERLRADGVRVVRLSGAPAGADPGGRREEAVTGELPAPAEPFSLVLFTSGTTGAPKAISVPGRLVARRVAGVSTRLGFGPDARVFLSGLLNNTTGVIFSFGALLHSATLVVPSGRDVATWPQQVAQLRATHVMLRPVALRRFVDAVVRHPVDLSSLQVVAYGAAAMPRPLLEQARRLAPCRWVQGYGLSETYGPFCWLDEEDHRVGVYRRHSYCVGRPDGTLEVDLLPVPGEESLEVAVRGEVMDGYLDVTSGTLHPPGEWLRTGDLGEWSPEGHLLLKGRLSQSVLSSDGHRIHPEEVEAVLGEVPGVDDVVLVPLPGPDGGERPVVCVSGPLGARDGDEVRTALTAALRGTLSPEKWPELAFATDVAFPRSGNDKVLRPQVATRAAAGPLIRL